MPKVDFPSQVPANDPEYLLGANATVPAKAKITAAGRALIQGANDAAMRATLGLGTAATEDATDFDPAGAAAAAQAYTRAGQPTVHTTQEGLDVLFDGGGAQPTTFFFTQNTPSTVWTINHPLTGYPSVVARDSAGSEVEGEISYPSTTQVVLTFSVAISGTVQLN